MDEKSTIKDLMNQAANVKHYVDEVNRKYFGLTAEEIIRAALTGKGEHDGDSKESK